MTSNLNEMNYELIDERKIVFDYDGINKIEVGQNEDLNRFCCKAILIYILNELNHDVICDYFISGVGKVDLYDITSRVIYNFQNVGLYSIDLTYNDILIQNCVEVVNIPVDDLPSDLFQRYLKLKEYVYSD